MSDGQPLDSVAVPDPSGALGSSGVDEVRRAAAVTSLRWTGALIAMLVVWLLVSVAARSVAALAPVITIVTVVLTVIAWRAAARGTGSRHPVSTWAVLGVVLDVLVSIGVVVIVGWALLLLVALARS